jgi:glycosyltransferase involved in cell wall biosynthesis
MELSVVVCVYNEEDNIRPMVERIEQALIGFDYEMVFVDDGSTDNTRKVIKDINHKRLRLIEFAKNYGQSSALAGGIEYAQGDYIVTIDGDLQNDPSDIPMMLEIAKEGDWDLVAGIRKKRQDGMLLRKVPSKIANGIIRHLTEVKMKDYGCTLKVFKAPIAKSIGLYGELHRFIPVLVNLEGGTITQVDVKHQAREHGKSKYGIGRTLRVVSDLMFMLFLKKYVQKPMHLFGGSGFVIFFIGIFINLYLFIQKIMGHDIWGKPMLFLGVLLIITGIQLITIGIIAEQLMRTYFESQNKKPYNVRRTWQGEN